MNRQMWWILFNIFFEERDPIAQLTDTKAKGVTVIIELKLLQIIRSYEMMGKLRGYTALTFLKMNRKKTLIMQV